MGAEFAEQNGNRVHPVSVISMPHVDALVRWQIDTGPCRDADDVPSETLPPLDQRDSNSATAQPSFRRERAVHSRRARVPIIPDAKNFTRIVLQSAINVECVTLTLLRNG
jgi:hypothetical protein